jgi:DNA modification methylase
MKTIKSISIKCETKDYLDCHNITEFQGGLKIRDEADIEKAKTSILKYGWSFPFFVWVSGKTNYCLDGHARLLVLKQLEEEGYLIPELPVVYITAKNRAEAKQKLLRLNSNFGHLTKESVLEFAEDIDLNFDEIALPDTVIDFTDATEPTETEGDDEVPEVDEKSEPVSKRGEMYELGNSILMCGDSTNAEDVARLMGGEKASLTFTDPPYELGTQGGGILKTANSMKQIEHNEVNHFDPMKLEIYSETNIYFHNKPLIKKYIELAEEKKLPYDLAFYKKTNTVPNYKGHLMTDCEYIAIIGKQDPNKGLDKELYSKCFIGKKDADNELSYSKPVALCEKYLKLYAKGNVLDLFGGSGSTLIASEKLGLKCFMIEHNPKMCDVIRKRYTKWAVENGKPKTSGCLD